MKVKFIGRDNPLALRNEKVYEVVNLAKDIFWYIIQDETGDLYMYDPKLFVIVEGGLEDFSPHIGENRKEFI